MNKKLVAFVFPLIFILVLTSCTPASTVPATQGVQVTLGPDEQTSEPGAATPVPDVSTIISSANVNNLVEIAQWGLGSGHHPTFSADGGTMAVSSMSGIYLYDSQTLEEINYFAQTDVVNMAFSPDGKSLAAVSGTYYDNTVKQWDLASGSELNSWSMDKAEEVNQSTKAAIAALSPDGKTAAISFDQNTVKLWDAASGQELRSLSIRFAADVAFSADGQRLASAEFGSVTVWDLSSGSPVRTLDTGPVVISLAFSPDGKTLAVGSDHSSYGTGEDNTSLWDVASGSEIISFNTDLPFQMGTVEGFSLAYSPDGEMLASGSASGSTISLWEAASGKEVRSLNVSNLESLSFSPDGKRLVSASSVGDDTVKVWDVASGSLVNSLNGDSVRGGVVFSPDSRTAAYASDDFTVRLRDLASGEVTILGGHPGFVSSIAFLPDGKTLASGSGDGSLLGPTGINTLKLWDAASGSELQTLNGHTAQVSSVAFSPDGKWLASGSFDQSVRLWDLSSGSEVNVLRGHTSLVYCVAFSPDGKTLASGSEDDTVRLWDAASGSEVRTLSGHVHQVMRVAFSPDGKELVSWSYDEIKVWETASGQELHSFSWDPDTYAGPSIAFSPDGKTLDTGLEDGTVRLWDAASMQELTSWSGGSTAVSGLAFSPDGKILASGGGDTVKLWEAASGQELGSIEVSHVTGVDFSPDGRLILTRSFYSMVRLWGVRP